MVAPLSRKHDQFVAVGGYVHASAEMRRILFIGAYERDNFGDLLFYHVTRAFFRSSTIAAGSMKSPHHSWNPGFDVKPFGALLAEERWDVVWVVGGEVGGVDVEGALAMSLSHDEAAIFANASEREKQAISRFLTGAELDDPAYMPDLSRYPMNASTPLVLNSAGLGNIALTEGEVFHRSVDIVNSAAAISVRDHKSRDFASSLEVPVQLAPDIVHSISRVLPLADVGNRDHDYFAFQMNSGVFARTDRAELVDQLLQIHRSTGFSPLLFPAGLALHHDSLEDFRLLQADLLALMPDCGARLATDRDPLVLSSLLAGAKLWLGTSLHGRIVASSYGVARVSLESPKAAAYCDAWDSVFPSAVDIGDIASSAHAALELAKLPESREASEELVQLAIDSTERNVRAVL